MVHKIAFILVIIGGLNWLLIGAINWGVGNVLGDGLSRIIYLLVGLSALYLIFTHKSSCKSCEKGGSAPMGGMNQ